MMPRTYQPIGLVMQHSHAIMLRDHPEAFDCIIYPAQSAEHDESLAENRSVGTLLDSDERAQSYDPPIVGRAMIIPSQELDFDATDSGGFEAFNNATESIRLLLSETVRRYSLVQWLEYLTVDSEETVERTVYVQDVLPAGRTLNAGNVYVCYPLPALGEVPQAQPDTDADTAEHPQETMPDEGNGADTETEATGFKVREL